MKVSICGFNQEFAVTLKKEITENNKTKVIKIDCTDLVILRWFTDYYPAMKKVEVDGKQYVWFNHEKVLEDIPLLDITKRSVIDRLQKLVEFKLLSYKFVKKGGTFSLYDFGENYTKLIETTTNTVSGQPTTVYGQPTTTVSGQPTTTVSGQPTTKIYNNNFKNNNNYNNYNISLQDMQTSKEVCDTQLKTTPSGNFREREGNFRKEEKDLKIIDPKQMFGNKSLLKKQSSINSKIKYLVENKNITNQKFINLFRQWLDVVYDKGFIPKPVQLDLIIKKLENIKNSYGTEQMFTTMEDTIRVGYKDFNYCAPRQFNKPVNNEYQVFNPDSRLTKAEREKQLKNITYTGEKF